MKKNDIAVLIVIVAISVGVAFFVGKAFLGDKKPEDTKVEVIDEISAEIQPPNPAVFNNNAINPAVSIKIGNSTNQQPFGQ